MTKPAKRLLAGPTPLPVMRFQRANRYDSNRQHYATRVGVNPIRASKPCALRFLRDWP